MLAGTVWLGGVAIINSVLTETGVSFVNIAKVWAKSNDTSTSAHINLIDEPEFLPAKIHV